MSLTEKEREIAWDRTAKGKGNRWRMLRDLVAVLSLQWMNLTKAQDTMMLYRGLSRAKISQMMQELERAGCVKPVSGEMDGITIAGYSSTDKGVLLWLGKEGRRSIPASIARVATISTVAKTSEPTPGELKNEKKKA